MINGETFIVVAPGNGIVYIWSNVADPSSFTFPSTIDTDTINSDPVVVCFLAGTRIAAPGGPRKIEDLALGDLVLTAAGETRPIRWIGRRTVVAAFADPLHAYPIRVGAGALGENLPADDLLLSPDHALLIDGALVHAAALVNGSSVARVARPAERFTYFHIELEDHALVLAEGVPAETFVDNVTRRRFDNHAEYAALFGEDRAAIVEMDLPRIKSARQLPAPIRERLAARAGTPDAKVA
ncbi:Hint domain-containing protein [Ancylobacter sonchi]|uniref:Hint domain-containing protein n=1 Tax=Ancylobacter sonchi TaxID=1937790 RepID=UPI001BD2B4BB|nr:Hint domain-containing protein [Ancylobacter sonchi]MBS7535060.1 Hint domain-containing protein [Ancylobacter sonchi]